MEEEKTEIMNKIAEGEDWMLHLDALLEEITLSVSEGGNSRWVATQYGCSIMLPPAVIDAIRDLPARQIPHLRQQRERIFSERAKKGWRTRRNENWAQMDADVRTMLEMKNEE